jgi:hypothetical protein
MAIRKRKISRYIDKHPVVFGIVLTFLLVMLLGGIEEYSRACKKEWGSKWEGNTKITVYEFNGIFCSFIRWFY